MCNGLKSIATQISDEILLSETEDIEKEIYHELENDEKYITEKGKNINDKYFKNKGLGKWKLCANELLIIKNNILIEQKKSIEELHSELKEIRKKGTEYISKMIEEEHKYPNNTAVTINLALNKINEYAIKKQTSKILISKDILEEIDLLHNFPDESIEKLESLIQKIDEGDDSQEFESKKYLELDLTDTFKYVENNNYVNLGIEKKNWEEISQNRKEDIIKAITNWESLKNKPTAREDIKTSDYKTVENELLTLIK